MQTAAKMTLADSDRRPEAPAAARARILLVGAPNVGKSALFNALTGRYVVVSNYPGTTVEISRGRVHLPGGDAEVLDTPGMYSLLPVSEEERLTQRILLFDAPDLIVHVVDAKNLERMLPLTLQLRELGTRVILAVNMIDEAQHAGMRIDLATLREVLGIPVVGAVAVKGYGVPQLRGEIARALAAPPPAAPSGALPPPLEGAVAAVARLIEGTPPQLARARAQLLLQGDAEVEAQVAEAHPPALHRARSLRMELCNTGEDPAFTVARHQHSRSRAICAHAVQAKAPPRLTVAQTVGALLVNPWTGIPALLLVLYFGLYQFVGVFGAGTVVDVLENDLFGAHFAPWFNAAMEGLLPGDGGWRYWLRELFAGEYGLVTLGVTYAVAIVLPIVSLFFLFFSVLEDSGYFPRLAMLVDRVFKRIGLNGRAVIPVVLGFACDTMATMVTRVQETRRERIITTFLLALAVPCSAQYGVMAAVLIGESGGAMTWPFLAWAALVAGIFLLSGLVASRVVRGAAPGFYMELPPMRLPRPGAVLLKTFSRMKWYFAEILPLFLLASVLIWVGRVTGLFAVLTGALVPVVRALGLPDATSEIFLYGFFRRDFGAAGLYDLSGDGAMSAGQILVAAVALTLFMPCVAQVLVMARERGAKTTAVIAGLVITLAFGVALVVRHGLGFLGVMS